MVPGSNIGPRYMLRDFLLGSIKVHIRHHAAQEPVYGLALIGAGFLHLRGAAWRPSRRRATVITVATEDVPSGRRSILGITWG
jgi:hypothetical protein